MKYKVELKPHAIKVQETLEDYEDLRVLRAAKAKEKNAKTISLKEAKKRLHLN